MPKFQPVTVPVQVIPNPGFCLAAGDHHRAQPGIRGTPAAHTAADGSQADAAEEAEVHSRRGAEPGPRASLLIVGALQRA